MASDYSGIEEVLQLINSRYISLSDIEIKRNNVILKQVLTHMVMKMQQKNPLFKSLFREIFYGGSYYDGLKVGYPNEYDIDLLLCFPNNAQAEVKLGNKPGYVQICLHEKSGFENFCEDERPYVDNRKVLRWMEGVVQNVMNDLKVGGYYSLQDICDHDLYLWMTKGGPAFTLHIHGTIDNNLVEMDVDLVPCFNFTADKLPKQGFKQPINNDFFIVPKPPKSESNDRGRYWRLSFQKQEKTLIGRKEKLKPAIRLLKKMRTTLKHDQISSYYLKTVALWEVEQINVWQSYSLHYTFMQILKKYKECLLKGCIPYYWYPKFNLLENIKSSTLINIANYLSRIISNIEKNERDDPLVVAQYLLTPSEHAALLNEEEEPEIPDRRICTIL